MKKLLTILTNFITLIIDDVILLVGVFFISYGVFSIYIPAGHITLGISLVIFAYLIAKRKSETP